MQLHALRWHAPGLALAFSTRDAGDCGERAVRAGWFGTLAPGRPLAVPGQVHGARVAAADDLDALRAADGVVTTDPRQGIGVLGADCPGLVLDAGDALGAAHCGWRGCAAGIVEALVAALARRSRRPPAHWRAFVGPGIAGLRYEVDAPVLDARAWPVSALRPARPGHALLDLRSAIAADLRRAGVENLRVSAECTAADPRLHSYRRQGRGCSQLLAAWRSPLA